MTTVTDHPDVAAALRGRHLLTLDDFTAEEITYLLDLAAELKAAKRAGTRGAEAGRQGDRADLREGLDPHALRVRGRRLRPGRARHLHRPERLAHGPQGDGQGHRARARPDVRRDRVPRLRRDDRRRARRSGPACRSTTASPTSGTRPRSSPTSSRSASTSPSRSSEIAFCYLGDARFNMADTYLVGGREARHGRADRRAASRCGRRTRSSSWRARSPRRAGATITITEDVDEAVRGADVLLTDVWVSMGEPDEVWARADRAADAVPGQRADDGADRQPGRQVHALPAGVPQHRHRRSARRSTRSSA